MDEIEAIWRFGEMRNEKLETGGRVESVGHQLTKTFSLVCAGCTSQASRICG